MPKIKKATTRAERDAIRANIRSEYPWGAEFNLTDAPSQKETLDKIRLILDSWDQKKITRDDAK